MRPVDGKGVDLGNGKFIEAVSDLRLFGTFKLAARAKCDNIVRQFIRDIKMWMSGLPVCSLLDRLCSRSACDKIAR